MSQPPRETIRTDYVSESMLEANTWRCFHGAIHAASQFCNCMVQPESLTLAQAEERLRKADVLDEDELQDVLAVLFPASLPTPAPSAPRDRA